MQRHVANYYKALKLTKADEVFCEICGYIGQEIHHVQHRQKNNPQLDEAENLICLCVNCHKEIHKNNTWENKQVLQEIVNKRMGFMV